MSRVCQVTGKSPMSGNNVSHAKNRRKRRFLPNLHTHRFWVAAEKRFVSLRVSSNGMRIIDKRGIESVLSDMRARGEKVWPTVADAEQSPAYYEPYVRVLRKTWIMRDKIKLVSSAGTGHFYTTTKNKRTMTGKLEIKKFDPVVRQHVMYKEAKIK